LKINFNSRTLLNQKYPPQVLFSLNSDTYETLVYVGPCAREESCRWSIGSLSLDSRVPASLIAVTEVLVADIRLDSKRLALVLLAEALLPAPREGGPVVVTRLDGDELHTRVPAGFITAHESLAASLGLKAGALAFLSSIGTLGPAASQSRPIVVSTAREWRRGHDEGNESEHDEDKLHDGYLGNIRMIQTCHSMVTNSTLHSAFNKTRGSYCESLSGLVGRCSVGSEPHGKCRVADASYDTPYIFWSVVRTLLNRASSG